MNQKVLISETGVGSQGRIVLASSLPRLQSKVNRSAFARVSYTNHGAHPRIKTWYPVMALSETECDFRFETTY
jgi:hypothetical protein